MILHGDCLTQLKVLDPNSIDSLVTDPPAGISFMGKDWDADKGGRREWINWMTDVMQESMRVMKPGAHGLVWALPRTSHWTAMALEDAGFEIRDCVYHLFGQGFPKSLDVSKAIDKAAGAEREVIGKNPSFRKAHLETSEVYTARKYSGDDTLTAPATDDAKRWAGWGTALKPAVECWWLVRKPLSEKTVAKNVLKWGTGALNIDGSRIGTEQTVTRRNGNSGANGRYGKDDRVFERINPPGRFPSHLVLSHTPHCTDDQCDIECAIKQLDEQSLAGGMHSAGVARNKLMVKKGGNASFEIKGPHNMRRLGDSGGASRFFYCAKISSSERGEFNKHPTVKPQKLMRYLINMVTPPGGAVLDPFTGSGSTGVAAKALGFKFVGIEREAEYVAIAEKRIEACTA